METHEDVCLILESLRRRYGMSSETLAGLLGISVTTLLRWELKESTPSRLAWRSLTSLLEELGAATEKAREEREGQNARSLKS